LVGQYSLELKRKEPSKERKPTTREGKFNSGEEKGKKAQRPFLGERSGAPTKP